MKINPVNKGILTENFLGIGIVTLDMVNARARELAIIHGRSSQGVSQSNWDQAKRDLTETLGSAKGG